MVATKAYALPLTKRCLSGLASLAASAGLCVLPESDLIRSRQLWKVAGSGRTRPGLPTYRSGKRGERADEPWLALGWQGSRRRSRKKTGRNVRTPPRCTSSQLHLSWSHPTPASRVSRQSPGVKSCYLCFASRARNSNRGVEASGASTSQSACGSSSSLPGWPFRRTKGHGATPIAHERHMKAKGCRCTGKAREDRADPETDARDRRPRRSQRG